MVTAKSLLSLYRGELGVREDPLGSNRGPRVRQYQASTGAYGAAWCVSFLQFGLWKLGVPRIANRSAGVFYCVDWARKNGCLRYSPKPGYLAAYMWAAGHIGIVEELSTGGGFTAIEGNASNMVRRKWRDGRNTVYIRVPGVDYGDLKPVIPPPPKQKWVPRFQIVAGQGTEKIPQKAQVIVGWNKWNVIQARIPRLVAQGRAFRIRRKLVRNK
jgi:hypothetical protein